MCAPLALDPELGVVAAEHLVPPSRVMRYIKSADEDNRVATFGSSMRETATVLSLQLATTPGGALFEATVTLPHGEQQQHFVSPHVGRLNKYGDQPHCVATRLPHLRPYCVCR